MNSLIYRFILFALFLTVKLSQTKELVKNDELNSDKKFKLINEDIQGDIYDDISNHKSRVYEKNDFKIRQEDNSRIYEKDNSKLNLEDISKEFSPKDQQTSLKPINCDRMNSEFFRYLLKRYNKDNQQTGRMKRLCNNLEYAATHCNKPNENNLFDLIQNSNQLNEDDFNFSQSVIKLCPLILFRIQEKTCTVKATYQNSSSHPRPNAKHVWIFALLFVTIISCCSLVGVVVMPFANNNTDSYKDAFNLFEGLAVGSLVASSLFHLLPQAFNLTADKNDDYLCKAMLIFGGIYLFFWSEILMKLMAELRKRKKKKSISQANLELLESEMHLNKLLAKDPPELNGETKNSDKKLTIKSSKDEIELQQEPQQIAAVAWMIIFGDGLHNFIDGLSIGAAFSESIFSGISVSLAVIFEELPHELGDFAILIASGMTIKQAIYYNFLSACTCYIGAIVGILIGDLTSVSDYILGLAGGMFLYVALVNIMAELTSAIDEALLKSKTKMFKVLFYQNVGILTGILCLFLLAKYSESIKIDHLLI